MHSSHCLLDLVNKRKTSESIENLSWIYLSNSRNRNLQNTVFNSWIVTLCCRSHVAPIKLNTMAGHISMF